MPSVGFKEFVRLLQIFGTQYENAVNANHFFAKSNLV